MQAKLEPAFYRQPDVIDLARRLLGATLMTRLGGDLTGGRIVETEAYAGPEDRASHAYANRRTARTDVMFRDGGVAYVYLCYGVHHLFNVVTNVAGIPHAILIRALEPTYGLETMRRRRGPRPDARLASGPGALSSALGMTTALSGESLSGDRVWIEAPDRTPRRGEICRAPRVGVDYAGPHARRPWRFYLAGNPCVSRPIPTPPSVNRRLSRHTTSEETAA